MKYKFRKLIKEKPLLAGCAVAWILLSVCVLVITFKILSPPKEDVLYLKPSLFAKLNNWQKDNQQLALGAFAKSCYRILKKSSNAEFGVGGIAGKVKPWQEICSKLRDDIASYSAAEARQFFEENFNVYEARGKNRRKGLFTGYYEPTLYGSLTKSDKYNIPLYARPENLIDLDLGKFADDLKGRKIIGMVDGKNFIPYHKRVEIENGAIINNEKVIVWVDNPVDSSSLSVTTLYSTTI